MKRFLQWSLYVGKVFVGIVFFTSAVMSLVLIVGFFGQGMEWEYFEKNGVFFTASMALAIASFFPAWRWRKEIWINVVDFFTPFL